MYRGTEISMWCRRMPGRVLLCSVLIILVGCLLLHLLINTNPGTILLRTNLTPDLSEDQITYRDRRSTLLETCAGKERTYNGNEHIERHLMVDHKHSLVYCPVAKIASTFWKRVFQVSSGVKSGMNPFDIKGAHDQSLITLSSMSFQLAHWTLTNYTTFLFVREPYSRLLACYIDKFFTTNPGFWNIGKIIIQRFRPNATEKSRTCGHDVTFPEFIKFVIDTLETGKYMNEHWKPIYEQCSPCQVQYDIIGKLESVSSDLDYLLLNKLDGDVLFEEMETESEKDRLEKNAQGLFNRYNSVAQSCMPLKDHLIRFLRKEQVRGIISKSVVLPNRLVDNNNTSANDLKEFIIKAYQLNDHNKKRKLNRKEALQEAYSDVPLDDMIKLQEHFKPDFELFGYNLRPEELYNEQIRKDTRKFYFNV